MTATLPYRVLTGTANTPEWLGLRKSGVGASESPAILGDSAWGTARSVYDQKITERVEDFTTDLMEFGHLAEDVIEKFMLAHPERYGYLGEILPSEGLLQSVEWPWLLGTLDRMLLTPAGDVVPLEFKSIGDYTAAEWKVGDDDNEFGDALYKVPKKYQVQVQQQMAVRGSPYGYIAAWLGKGQLVVIRIERDDEYIAEYLIGRVGDFWNYNVVPRIPPAATLNDDLWKVYPGERGKTIEATEDIFDAVGLFRVNADDGRERKKEMDQLKFDITDFMGDATELLDPMTKEVIHTLRGQNTPRGTNFLLLEAKYPEAYEECIRPAGWTRVHRPTKVKVG